MCKISVLKLILLRAASCLPHLLKLCSREGLSFQRNCEKGEKAERKNFEEVVIRPKKRINTKLACADTSSMQSKIEKYA
jgi:hypothetical protein